MPDRRREWSFGVTQSTANPTANQTDPGRLGSMLTLKEKTSLLTGIGPWTLTALPSIGLRTITVSDGPIGIRGSDDPARQSVQLPAPSALAATWDVDLQRRVGRLIAAEARRNGIDVVLAPVVNLQRTPVSGRHFEFFSEDPHLTARLAVAYVTALQAEGVGACVKHFVGNETETDRTGYVAHIDERALREVFLAPFEAVVEAGVWSLMAAYNGVRYGGVEAPATEHGPLLNGLLKGEWGFDGVVFSDWLAAKDGYGAVRAGLDLIMPGPGGPWADLHAAIERGEVGTGAADAVDDKVHRIVRLAARVGALSGTPGVVEPYDERGPHPDPDSAEVRGFVREVAARATVMLRNDGDLLPLAPDGVRSVALIGANAVEPFVQGGGSSSVHPPGLSHPLDALRAAFPHAEVVLERGGGTESHGPVIPASALRAPDGRPGVHVAHLDDTGAVVAEHVEAGPGSIWFAVPDRRVTRVRITTDVVVGAGGPALEVGPVGAHRVIVDGELLSCDETVVGPEIVLTSGHRHPRMYAIRVPAAEPRAVRVEADVQVVDAAGFGRFVRFYLHHRPDGPTPDEELELAVAAAARSEVAVVVVGTNPESESEGWDRTDLQLPSRQNELVRRVAEANPRTVVVVNAGAPAILPWLDEVPAVLWWWLPGQEAGDALAAVLTGEIEPSGRLPWTLPADEADVPVPHGTAVDGVVTYDEGLDVGYRGWDRLGRTPAREFGFGLGYTTWDYVGLDVVDAEGADGDVRGATVGTAEVTVRNTGPRDGREVVQLYAQAPADGPVRPVRWLVGFAVVDVPAGAEAIVRIPLPHRAFEVWDVEGAEWRLPAGSYRLRAGRSSRHLDLERTLELG
jgi:beta-glucosidase